MVVIVKPDNQWQWCVCKQNRGKQTKRTVSKPSTEPGILLFYWPGGDQPARQPGQQWPFFILQYQLFVDGRPMTWRWTYHHSIVETWTIISYNWVFPNYSSPIILILPWNILHVSMGIIVNLMMTLLLKTRFSFIVVYCPNGIVAGRALFQYGPCYSPLFLFFYNSCSPNLLLFTLLIDSQCAWFRTTEWPDWDYRC